MTDNEIAKPPVTSQSIRVAFAMYGYLQNVNTEERLRTFHAAGQVLNRTKCRNYILKAVKSRYVSRGKTLIPGLKL